MTAPTELPDTLEIANSRLRMSPAATPSPPSISLPMALAVKKPARLAPPDAATMIGRGQAAPSSGHALACFHSRTASCSFSR